VYQAFAGPRHWVLYPDTLAALKSLREQGCELGIISNFDTRLFTVLTGLGLAELFDTVTISSLARAAKPAPQIFRLALEKHAMEAEEALHIGDSLRQDVEGARAANVTGLLLDREQTRASGHIRSIKSLDELPRILKEL
jgi:putative hydrolase of the HAD superfamily